MSTADQSLTAGALSFIEGYGSSEESDNETEIFSAKNQNLKQVVECREEDNEPSDQPTANADNEKKTDDAAIQTKEPQIDTEANAISSKPAALDNQEEENEESRMEICVQEEDPDLKPETDSHGKGAEKPQLMATEQMVNAVPNTVEVETSEEFVNGNELEKSTGEKDTGQEAIEAPAMDDNGDDEKIVKDQEEQPVVNGDDDATTVMVEKPAKDSWRQDGGGGGNSESGDSEDDSSSSSSSDTSDSSSDDESSADEQVGSDEDEEEEEEDRRKTATSKQNGKQKNKTAEFSLSDLPPIEDLHISVPEFECVELGRISSIVDTLVVVQSLPNKPAVDVDTVLFLEKGKRPLGKVFDVIGPVATPYYCVRFNSADHIKEQKGVEKGTEVFLAPRTPHTSFIFFEQLLKMKGTDASWKDDQETPAAFADYSDDEAERAAKNKNKKKKDAANQGALARKEAGEVALGAPPRKEQRRGARAYQPPRAGTQLSQNAFYRQNRRYNPRDAGPIRWDHSHANLQHPPQHHQGYTRPPPPHMPPPSFAGTGGGGYSVPPPGYFNPHQQQLSAPPPGHSGNHPPPGPHYMNGSHPPPQSNNYFMPPPHRQNEGGRHHHNYPPPTGNAFPPQSFDGTCPPGT